VEFFLRHRFLLACVILGMLSVTAAVPSIPLPALLAKDARDENHGPQRLAVIE